MSTKPTIAQEPEVEAPLTEGTVEETAEAPAEEASTTSLAASEEGDLTFSDADEDLDSEDSLTFSNGVIEKIVAIAVRTSRASLAGRAASSTASRRPLARPIPRRASPSRSCRTALFA